MLNWVKKMEINWGVIGVVVLLEREREKKESLRELESCLLNQENRNEKGLVMWSCFVY
jgi:hypothetical protein